MIKLKQGEKIYVYVGGHGADAKAGKDSTNGYNGGGLKGLTNRTRSVPGTQTSGYKFGVGQDGYGTGDSDGVAGSGGGYYGGTTSDYADVSEAGAGGSSFISGYSGCDAIAENSTENNIVHTGQSIHYSNRSFIDGVILDGKSTQIEKMENGFAKITFMGYTY